MSRIVLSEAARLDRRVITQYTVERFGVLQARRLRDSFEAALHALADTPLMGHTNAELDPPGHSFRYHVFISRFIIVYEPSEEGIRVARLLHGARSPAAELARDPGKDEG
jgi:plasmid stabilization system protein ParE